MSAIQSTLEERSQSISAEMPLVAVREPLVLERSGSFSERLETLEMQSLVCPLSQATFRDPVVASDGHTYEYEELRKLFELSHNNSEPAKSPMTREPLFLSVYRNRALRQTLDTLMERDGYDVYEANNPLGREVINGLPPTNGAVPFDSEQDTWFGVDINTLFWDEWEDEENGPGTYLHPTAEDFEQLVLENWNYYNKSYISAAWCAFARLLLKNTNDLHEPYIDQLESFDGNHRARIAELERNEAEMHHEIYRLREQLRAQTNRTSATGDYQPPTHIRDRGRRTAPRDSEGRLTRK